MKIFSLLIFSALLISCSSQVDMAQQTANHIARPAFMVQRVYQTDLATLTLWERIHQNGGEATIYIEGDNPPLATTPDNPVGLHLASRDLSKNLVYISRPCHFIKFPEQKNCPASDLNSHFPYTQDVIDSYQAALNTLTSLYGLSGFHLVGYGGGANIATILAAENNSVLSLRTVAGNLNPDLQAHLKNRSLQANNLNATHYASRLANLPQIHFIGGADTTITPAIYHSYRQSLGLSDCIQYSLIADADHQRGWVEKWPDLLAIAPKCDEAYKELLPMPPAPIEIPDTGFGKTIGK